jgi:hypothetical protein
MPTTFQDAPKGRRDPLGVHPQGPVLPACFDRLAVHNPVLRAFFGPDHPSVGKIVDRPPDLLVLGSRSLLPVHGVIHSVRTMDRLYQPSKPDATGVIPDLSDDPRIQVPIHTVGPQVSRTGTLNGRGFTLARRPPLAVFHPGGGHAGPPPTELIEQPTCPK